MKGEAVLPNLDASAKFTAMEVGVKMAHSDSHLLQLADSNSTDYVSLCIYTGNPFTGVTQLTLLGLNKDWESIISRNAATDT